MKTYSAEVFDTEKNSLGESPFYVEKYDRYSWVDITKGRLWTMTQGKKECFELGQPIGAAIPMKDCAGFILAAMDGLYEYRNGNASLLKDLTPLFKSYWRSNDAKMDPYGRIYFGASVNDDHEAEGSLFLYDKGDVKVLLPDTKISNGMAFSSDEKYFYFSDSLEYAVFKFDYNKEDGSISNRRVLLKVENGVPDGLCIDNEDNLYVAIWGGSRIEKRSGADGSKLGEISVPAEHVTSCAMAKGGKELFITSSGDGLEGEYDGCLFTCRISE